MLNPVIRLNYLTYMLLEKHLFDLCNTGAKLRGTNNIKKESKKYQVPVLCASVADPAIVCAAPAPSFQKVLLLKKKFFF
jgi:hypothetical protein